ncbi:MAG: hypothetical protein WAX44_03755 [Minisyncoccia bacterium]
MPRSRKAKAGRNAKKQWAHGSTPKKRLVSSRWTFDARMAASNDRPPSDVEADECARLLLDRK